MSLTVTIPDTFNGPLDLLLHLIRREEMDIYDIPIGRLAASYLEELDKMAIVNVDEGAEFLDLASRLLEIKSRMLIPPEERLEEGEDEEEDFDPRTGLVEALLEYRRFKDAARLLGEMAEEQSRRYPRIPPRMEFRFVEETGDTADCLDLLTAFQSMLERMMPGGESADVISSTEISIHTRIEQIETVLLDVGKTRFSLLLSGTPNRGEMVGFFIAVLELIRRGLLTARQNGDFSDIILERREPSVSREAARPKIGRRRVIACFPAAQVRSGRQAAAAPSLPPFPAAAGICRRRAPGTAGKKPPAAFPAATRGGKR